MNIKMNFSKSTKNTHVYINVADDAKISQLYIQKSAYPDGPPKTITVTIK